MPRACPSCSTPFDGPDVPGFCPACGANLRAHAQAQAAAPTPVLIVDLPQGALEYPLVEALTIGRYPDNAVPIPDERVSGRHARVERSSDGLLLRDLHSSNGTFVNGMQVQDALLNDGDEIVMGSTRLVLRVGAAAAPSAPQPVAVVQASSVAHVLASAKPVAADEGREFLPASEIKDPNTLKQDYERLRIAYRFHQEGGLLTDERALLKRILDLALDWLPADNGSILLPDGAGGFRVALAKSAVGNQEITISQTLIDKCASTGEGILSADAATDQRFNAAKSIFAGGIRSVLAVPVVSRGQVRAIVYLDSRTRTAAFTRKDLEVLVDITGQAGVALNNAELLAKIQQEQTTRSQLERFLSPALVQQAAQGVIDLKKGGSVVTATILFSDIRGFTSMSEKVEAEDIVKLLNDYFEEMVDAVFKHHGILDKFIGDGMMALWGVPVARDGDAQRAVRAALEMQRRVAAYGDRLAAQGLPRIAIGIGINTGRCVVGNMGSSRRLEYTVIGDTVNLASRLCGVAKPGEVIVSEGTRRLIEDQFQVDALPAQQVKGKAQPVPVFRVRAEEMPREVTGVGR